MDYISHHRNLFYTSKVDTMKKMKKEKIDKQPYG